MTEYQKYPGRLDEDNPDSYDASGKLKVVLQEEVEVSPGVRKVLPTALGARLQALLDRTPDLKGGSIPVVTGGDATSPAVLNILDDEELTVAGVAVPLASIPAGATRAEIQVQGIDVRFKLLGAAKLPTATSGYIQYDGGSIVLLKAQIAAARFIAASNSGKLYVTYYGGN